MRKLPDTFIVGAATSAHQVEGNNIHSDCWAMEQLPHSSYIEPSGMCNDHYHRYEEDIRLLAEAGLNAYRFTIEWARIEPEEGRFDDNEIEHYRKVLDYCHKLGVEPVVTLHHFSSPKWLICKGGWKNEDTAPSFARYCKKIAEELGNQMNYVCTINEANMGLQMKRVMEMFAAFTPESRGEADETVETGDIQVGLNMNYDMAAYFQELGETFGCDPMDINQFLGARNEKEEEIVMKAHQMARNAIKEAAPWLKVGLSLSLYDYQPLEDGTGMAELLWREDFGIYRPWIEEDDFLGVQNYTRRVVDKNGAVDVPGQKNTAAGYEFYPKSIGGVLRHVTESWKKEILVTENGVSTEDDTERELFITVALSEIADCIEEGIPVRGYLH